MTTEEVKQKLMELRKIDQDARFNYIRSNEGKYLEQMKVADKTSTTYIKKLLVNFGLPTISKVGKDAAKSAWLLIQHSPDLKLMEKYLKMMEKNIDDINKPDYAMLKDRVLLQQKRKQIYGTQFRKNDQGDYAPIDLRNEKSVDKRRKEMGLDTLKENIERMKKMYD